jgi:hypothetical protein
MLPKIMSMTLGNIKMKLILEQVMKAQRGEEVQLYAFFNLGTGLGGGMTRYDIGGWVGPRACLNGCGKSRPPPGFDLRTFQPYLLRYPGP